MFSADILAVGSYKQHAKGELLITPRNNWSAVEDYPYGRHLKALILSVIVKIYKKQISQKS